MKKTVFLYSGEGTSDRRTSSKLLRSSTQWTRIEEVLGETLDIRLGELWEREIGRHRCPSSPLLTVTAQICLADLWSRWGHEPDVVVGHSTGELAAAYQAGLYSLEEVLHLAHQLGLVTAHLEGQMVHGTLSDEQIAGLGVNLSSINFRVDGYKHVTLSGYQSEIDELLEQHPDFVRMKLPHPWHHPDLARHASLLEPIASKEVAEGRFVSGVTARFETKLESDHWQRWLVQPIDFLGAMEAIGARLGGDDVEVVEIGFHPVLQKSCAPLDLAVYASSMHRGEDEVGWIMEQRRRLDQSALIERVREAIAGSGLNVDLSIPLAPQGVDSLDIARLADILQPFFPSLEPQDFYRYRTVRQLLDRFGEQPAQEEAIRPVAQARNDVVIAGMSCRLPASIETLPQYWEMLVSGQDQVRREAGRGRSEAGYLGAEASAFDHAFFDIAQAEASTMDPQQVLALELTEMLFRDAGVDPETLDRSRVGVYLGVWNQEYRGDRASVYSPTGTNPSIVASRISYHYDLRGPSWVSNTACSSSLVAVHYAAKDIEAGRVDYAIAGGVNMLLDEGFSATMRSAGFLSEDDRCKTFDDSANGYVRAEGGGLVLLVNKALADRYYAELKGSAINQNGGRSQVITAPHPEAQEELIRAAIRDAAITPGELAYVECHGTGTKLGDPIELSALQSVFGGPRETDLLIGSVKSNIGHLESAAGIAGLIKCVAAVSKGVLPPNLHFERPNRYFDFDAYPIKVVTEETAIAPESCLGVSSFGFGGTNGHVIVKGAEASHRKEIRDLEVPFDRRRATPLGPYVRLEAAQPAAEVADEAVAPPSAKPMTREEIDRLVGELFFQLTSIEEIQPDVELSDQGLDSMSGTELIAKLEAMLAIEIEPEFLFENPLRDQFVDGVFELTRASVEAAQVA